MHGPLCCGRSPRSPVWHPCLRAQASMRGRCACLLDNRKKKLDSCMRPQKQALPPKPYHNPPVEPRMMSYPPGCSCMCGKQTECISSRASRQSQSRKLTTTTPQQVKTTCCYVFACDACAAALHPQPTSKKSVTLYTLPWMSR